MLFGRYIAGGFGCNIAGGMLFRMEGCFDSDFTADTFSAASSQWFC